MSGTGTFYDLDFVTAPLSGQVLKKGVTTFGGPAKAGFPAFLRADGYLDPSIHPPLGLPGSAMAAGVHMLGVPNGAFEDGATGWTIATTGTGSAVIDATASITGQNALNMTCAASGDSVTATSPLIPIGEAVGIVAALRAALVSGASNLSATVSYFNKSKTTAVGSPVAVPNSTTALTAAFVELGGTLTPPAGARYASITVTASGAVGSFRLDEVRLIRAANPTETPYQPPLNGGQQRTLYGRLAERVSVLDFIPPALHVGIAAGTDTTDLSTYLANAAAYAATPRSRLVFPSGIYNYSISPNWASNGARIRAEGEVRLRYSGTGAAVILDAGPVTTVNAVVNAPIVTNMRFGPFIVEAPASAGDGVYMRAICHSEVDVNVRGCGTSSAALRCLFGVCSRVKITASQVEGPWYGGGKPGFGIVCDVRPGNPADYSPASFIEFISPVIEGPAVGVVFVSTLGCRISGGTIESCSSYGLDLQLSAIDSYIELTDFEANAGFDIRDNGSRTKLANVKSLGQDSTYASTSGVIFGATSRNCSLSGCRLNGIAIVAGASDAAIMDGTILCNASGSTNGTGVLSDLGTRSVLRNLLDASTGKRRDGTPSRTVLSLPASATSGSPYNYTNATGVVQTLLISGGTGLATYFVGKSGAGDNVLNTGVLKLAPGEGVQLTYTAPPSVIVDI